MYELDDTMLNTWYKLNCVLNDSNKAWTRKWPGTEAKIRTAIYRTVKIRTAIYRTAKIRTANNRWYNVR